MDKVKTPIALSAQTLRCLVIPRHPDEFEELIRHEGSVFGVLGAGPCRGSNYRSLSAMFIRERTNSFARDDKGRIAFARDRVCDG